MTPLVVVPMRVELPARPARHSTRAAGTVLPPGGTGARPRIVHRLRMRRDSRGVLVWCSCRAWGYVGPDEHKARHVHQAHVLDCWPGKH